MKSLPSWLACYLLWSATIAIAADPVLTKMGRRADGLPIVIAHRGSSGERPEHTIAAYKLALEQGADLIEMDLQLSSDGVLVGLHDTTLDRVTDIADHPEFAARKKTDKNGKSSFWVRDFTFAELRTLRVRHVIGGKPTLYDREQLIPTFAEQIALVRNHNAKTKSRVGLCPELKNVGGLKAVGLDLEAAFLKAVQDHHLEGDESLPVVVQCFELETVERLRSRVKLPLAYLVGSRPDDRAMGRVLEAADILAVHVKAIQPDDSAVWIKSLHQRGLGVIAWTYKDDLAQMRAGIACGLDGYFTDFPAAGVAARKTGK